MRLIKKLIPGALPLAIARWWFLDPTHGPRRRAQARALVTDAGRRAQAGFRQLRGRLAGQPGAGPVAPPGARLSPTSEPDAPAYPAR